MTLQASNIVSRVRATLMDTGSYAAERWTDAELLQWLSDGQRAVIATAPRTSQKTAVISYVAGTRQSVPSDGWMLLSVYRNMGAGGATPGNALVLTPREHLDTQFPTWHAGPAVASPAAWAFDPSDPAGFWVYPSSDGTGSAQISYSKSPHEFVALTDNLDVQDIYAAPLYDYVMYRAQQKDSDYSSGQQAAMQYLNNFASFLQSLNKDPLTMATQKGQA